MKNDVGNLYLLQDGTQAAPGDCKAGKDGVLRHKNGVAVALRADGTPQTIGQGAVDNKNVEAAKVGDAPTAAEPKAETMPDMKAEPEPAKASK